MAKFINPFTDFGFKTIFGQEANKDLLIDFLNDLLEGERHIEELHYTDKEHPKHHPAERTVIYDIYCKDEHGEHFIVELQNRVTGTFKDRALFYLSTDIFKQGESGKWDYRIVPVYGIFILNGQLDNSQGKLRTDVVLMDRDTQVQFTDKLRMIFLELPHFTKREEECESNFEKWIYVLKHMETLERLPFESQKKIFHRLAGVVDFNKIMHSEYRTQYERDLKAYRDNLMIAADEKRAKIKAREDGLAEGRAEGLAEGRAKGLAEGRAEGRAEGETYAKRENAKKMKALGMDIQIISQVTGLEAKEIEAL